MVTNESPHHVISELFSFDVSEVRIIFSVQSFGRGLAVRGWQFLLSHFGRVGILDLNGLVRGSVGFLGCFEGLCVFFAIIFEVQTLNIVWGVCTIFRVRKMVEWKQEFVVNGI